MQTSRPCAEEDFKIVLEQIEKKQFNQHNKLWTEVQTFLNEREKGLITQLPDISLEQIQLIKEKLGKYKASFQIMLDTIAEIIRTSKSSLYKIKVNDEEITKYRMTKKFFATLYNNFPTHGQVFLEKLNYQTDISIDQLRSLISLYKTNTLPRQRLQTYLEFTEQHLVKEGSQELTEEEFNNIQSNILAASVDQLNQTIEYVRKNNIIISQEQMNLPIDYYYKILNKLVELEKYKGFIDSDLLFACRDIIPKIIYLSFQIACFYRDHPDLKIVNAFVFAFKIPIFYVSTLKADPLVITQIKQDFHLKHNNEYIHRQLINIMNQKNTIHHINGNLFDNTDTNLIEVHISKLEKEVFGQQYTSNQKHMWLHDIFNTEFDVKFWHNIIPLRQFANSFYNDFVQNHFYNPERMKFEIENVMIKSPQQNTPKLIVEMQREQLYYNSHK